MKQAPMLWCVLASAIVGVCVGAGDIPTPTTVPLPSLCCDGPIVHAACGELAGVKFAGGAVFGADDTFYEYSPTLPSLTFSVNVEAPLWFLVYAPSSSSNSWFVNGREWSIDPDPTAFQWVKFPLLCPPGELKLQVRERLTLLKAMYIGDEHPLSFGIDIDTCYAPTPSPSPDRTQNCCGTELQPAIGCASSVIGAGLSGSVSDSYVVYDGSEPQHTYAEDLDGAKYPLPNITDGELWLKVDCPTYDSNSWWIDCTAWRVEPTSGFEWIRYGQVHNDTVTLQGREPGCKLRALYFGTDNPQELQLSTGHCVVPTPTPLPETCCQSNLQHPQCAELTNGLQTVPTTWSGETPWGGFGDALVHHGSTPPVCDASVPAARFVFGDDTKGCLWAEVRCSGVHSNSWDVNCVRWQITPSNDWQWVEFGAVDSQEVILQAREANCLIRAVYLGDDNPNQLGLDIESCGTAENVTVVMPASDATKPPPPCQPSATPPPQVCCGTPLQHGACAALVDGAGGTESPEETLSIRESRGTLSYTCDSLSSSAVCGNGGSAIAPEAIFFFPDNVVGTLWLEVKCPLRAQDSSPNDPYWHVNCTDFVLPDLPAVTGDEYEWVEFGPVVGSTVSLQATRPGCSIRAVYLGPDNPVLEEYSVEVCTEICTPTPTPVPSPPPDECCGTDIQHAGCAIASGSSLNSYLGRVGYTADPVTTCDGTSTELELSFSFPSNPPSAQLWLQLYCPFADGATTSWFVDCTPFAAPSSEDYSWVATGPITSAVVTLQASAPNCKIGGVYLGVDDPNDLPFEECGNFTVPSPSSTPSPTATISTTPSPSPTVSVATLQMEVVEENGACQTIACVDESPDDATTIRFSFSVDKAVSLAVQPNCVSQGGKQVFVQGQFYCFTHVPAENLTDFELSDIGVYDLDPNIVTPFKAPGVQLVPGNTYPNVQLPVPAYSGVIDCSSIGGQIVVVRVAWLVSPTGGPCWFDDVTGRQLCVNVGVDQLNHLYFDGNGNQLPSTARWKDLLCPF